MINHCYTDGTAATLPFPKIVRAGFMAAILSTAARNEQTKSVKTPHKHECDFQNPRTSKVANAPQMYVSNHLLQILVLSQFSAG